MLKWQKFLLKLTLKKQVSLKNIIDKILSWDLNWLDIKSIRLSNGYYRCRYWKVRIIFHKDGNRYFIKDIDFRWNIYKW